jgi:hypothetical protein
VNYIHTIKSQFPNLPVTTVEPYDQWQKHPGLVDEVDIVSVNIYPYWDGIDISTADTYTIQRYNEIVAISKGKPVIISELGWPTAGPVYGHAVPSPANAKIYGEKMRSWAADNTIQYFWFEAFDENWKTEGGVGPHWGIWDSNGTIKYPFQDIPTTVPTTTLPSTSPVETPSGTGSVVVKSFPTGAMVYLDGTLKGTTPITIPGISSGTHQLAVTKSGYKDYSAGVTVHNGRKTRVTVHMRTGPATTPTILPTTTVPTTAPPEPPQAPSNNGTLSIKSIPMGAQVYLDGTLEGTTPITITNVSSGTHQLEVTEPGYQDYSTKVMVWTGKTASISPRLRYVSTITPTATTTPTQTMVWVSLLSPKNNENVKFTSDADGIYTCTINGLSSGVLNSNSRLLLWIRPINPPSERPGWYLQRDPNGVSIIHYDGSWFGIAQLGNAQWPPHTGDTFDVAVTITDKATGSQLMAESGDVVKSSPVGSPSDIAASVVVMV